MIRRPSSVHRPPLSTISNIFSETTWPIKAKFCVEPPGVRGTKVFLWHLGHMTKMAAMPIYGNLLLWTQLTDFHKKTCYVPSGTPAHHSKLQFHWHHSYNRKDFQIRKGKYSLHTVHWIKATRRLKTSSPKGNNHSPESQQVIKIS